MEDLFMKKKYKCKLLPYTKTKYVSLLNSNQKTGWGITAFDLPKAWQVTQGDGIKIAVLDTGADLDHQDISENLLQGINLIEKNSPPEDDNGHGTHVTGILVASNNDIGMVGVCPKAKVIPVKILDKNGNGNLFLVSDGIRWAADQGVDFITMSLGSPMKVQSVRNAIIYAQSKGVVVFCAAGNAGMTKEIFYPANYKETISIGAIKENFKRADFSCTGMNLDFMAPGENIFSTFPNNSYATLSGTSMACPFAVGVAALLKSFVKSGNSNLILNTTEDYRELFRKHSTDITDVDLTNSKFLEGFGIIDPRKLMNFCE